MGSPSGRRREEAELRTAAMRPREAWLLVLLLALAQLLAAASAEGPDEGERRRAGPVGGVAARTADVLQFEGGSGGQDRLGDPGEEGGEAAGAATEA